MCEICFKRVTSKLVVFFFFDFHRDADAPLHDAHGAVPREALMPFFVVFLLHSLVSPSAGNFRKLFSMHVEGHVNGPVPRIRDAANCIDLKIGASFEGAGEQGVNLDWISALVSFACWRLH